MPLTLDTIAPVAVWKNAELQAYCIAFVKAGLDLLQDGISYFGSDNVSESEQPNSHSIPGCAISLLRTAGVITDFFGTIRSEKITNGRRKSMRDLANGRKVNLFQLTSIGMAEQFLKRNAIHFESIQMRLL